MKNIRPIRTEKQYEQALNEIERLMEIDPDPNTPDGEQLELLSILVEAYEEQQYPIPSPDDPVEVILFYMEKNGLTRKDLELFIGNKARVSDILNRKRNLSINMIRKLHAGLGIPAELLITPISPSDIPRGQSDRVYS